MLNTVKTQLLETSGGGELNACVCDDMEYSI